MAYQTDTAAIAAIRAADDKRLKAMMASDLATLRQVLADELIYSHTGGRHQSKAEYLEQHQPGHYVTLTRSNDSVHVNGNTGWLHGKVRMELKRDGKITAREVLFISIWVLEGGTWRMATWSGANIVAAGH